MEQTRHTVILGDARQMPEIPDKSVQLVVTSPPYWQLKDYGAEDQLGFHDSYSDYINHLNLVWSECFRVLAPGCRICVNIGDQFARSVIYGRYKVIPIRTEIIRFLETLGADYMGSIIWKKVTTTNTTGGATIMGSFPYPRNGILKINYEFILVFKKQGAAPPPSREAKDASRMSTEDWNRYFTGVWEFPGEKQKKHLAMFPEKLPRRLIRMFTFAGETVLDPFLGSGTTSLAAKNLGRNSVGLEINPDFEPVILEKLDAGQKKLFNGAKVEMIRRKKTNFSLDKALDRLPYRFCDPVQPTPDKKARKKSYGSKVNGKEAAREAYYKVEQVEAPNRLTLKNGQKVGLLGVAPLEGKEQAAVRFLEKRTKTDKIYLREEKGRPEKGGRVWAYVYLQNKTPLNAHLIKKGLAAADAEGEYRKKKRFLEYAGKASGEK